jgi:hypothetical protein
MFCVNALVSSNRDPSCNTASLAAVTPQDPPRSGFTGALSSSLICFRIEVSLRQALQLDALRMDALRVDAWACKRLSYAKAQSANKHRDSNVI